MSVDSAYNNPTDLRVGEDVEIQINGYTRTSRVVELSPAGYTPDCVRCLSLALGDYILSYNYAPAVGVSWRRMSAAYGAWCRRCKNYFPEVETIEGWACYACRTDGYGVTWARYKCT